MTYGQRTMLGYLYEWTKVFAITGHNVHVEVRIVFVNNSLQIIFRVSTIAEKCLYRSRNLDIWIIT